MKPLLDTVPRGVAADFSRRTVVGTHRLGERADFSDAALIELLDRFPREHLHVHSMGTDPVHVEENLLAQVDGFDGATLLRAVHECRLWLNVTRIDRADARCRGLIDALYAELRSQLPGFAPDATQGTLLISSPQALVYYHADGPASVLWHLRGRKRIWVYPAMDTRFLPRAHLEDIFAGARHEYLPYQPEFDAAAEVFDLAPGDWIAWPHNAPHRVANLDGVNVSLATEHFTPASRRRFRVYVANRFLRTRLGWTEPSAREDGAGAVAKVAVQRIARKFGLDRVPLRQYAPSLCLLPRA